MVGLVRNIPPQITAVTNNHLIRLNMLVFISFIPAYPETSAAGAKYTETTRSFYIQHNFPSRWKQLIMILFEPVAVLTGIKL